MATQTFQIGDLTLRSRRELLGPAGAIALGSRALDVLSVLAEADGALITKDDLFVAVWGKVLVEENALHAQVSAARKALGSEARRLITVHGRGYRLDLDVPSARAVDLSDRASVAVLPFENRTGGSDQAYLVDGLAEELISRLARISGLKVPARTASFAYRGSATGLNMIASQLGVATLVEGSVRVHGDKLRVAVRLIDADSCYAIWSDSFDGALSDLLALQDDLASAIATALRHELQPRQPETHSPEAMRLVLQARAASATMRAEGLEEGLRFAQQAIDLDPGFAKAWESLAGTTFVMAGWGFAPVERMTSALEYARKAIALDPELAGAQALVGGIEATRGRFPEAMEFLQRAQELEPFSAVIKEQAALGVLLPVGRVADAMATSDHALSLSPARAIGLAVRSACAVQAGDVTSARKFLDVAIRLGQLTSRWLIDYLQAETLLLQGEVDEAALSMARLFERELDPQMGANVAAQVYKAYSQPADRDAASDAATQLLRKAERTGKIRGHFGNLGLFLTCQVRLGNLDAAFAVASRLKAFWRDEGWLATASLSPMWSPEMTSFRSDQRFQKLVQDLDLARFWILYGPPDGYEIRDNRLIEIQRAPFSASRPRSQS